MPRLSFSPTEAPGTDIMQLLLQAQKGRLEASYRRYRGTWPSSEGINRCSRGARRSRALGGDGHERHDGGTSPGVPYGLFRGGVVGRVLPQPLWSRVESRLRGRTPARLSLYSLRPRPLIHPASEKGCSQKQDIFLAGALALRLLRVLRSLDPGLPDLAVVLRPLPSPRERIALLNDRALQIVELLFIEYERVHKRTGL